MEIVQPSLFERINNWIKESIMIKLCSIGFLVLILLIPQAWIESLISERQYRAESVVGEIASKWSGQQNVTGPVMVIPYIVREKIDKGKDGFEIREWKQNAFFLPEDLKITGVINPQIRNRGIFEAVVYESDISLVAKFPKPAFDVLNIAEEDVLWKDAYLVVGIADLRGISQNPKSIIGGIELSGEPSSSIGLVSEYSIGKPHGSEEDATYQTATSEKGILLKLPWKGSEDFKGDASIQLSLKGSTQLYFSPVGKSTDVSLKGSWASPSFDGEFLPAEREVTDSGFSASWKILHYNRPFSQQWTVVNQHLSSADFGVRLVIPADQYQKSIRTAKYGVLIILLTFVSLFMVEIIKKVRIHPFQYILVGVALIIYYSLLLSISEHVGYNTAYGIASLATVILITLYSSTFLGTRNLMGIFTGLLVFFYTFIFVIIQLEDFSLLLGSIGLFLTVGLLMYFSKGIRWYKE